ncbi:Calcium-dependent protein kinase 12 [Salvia divinorum]|uniref:Calcium-dependent protein kinase 12 n=1 Tax=Salvia divinorum TaxID=28513 RepID=A0ABD1G074_SALDI
MEFTIQSFRLITMSRDLMDRQIDYGEFTAMMRKGNRGIGRENQILCVAPLSYKFSSLLTSQIDTDNSEHLSHPQCLAFDLNFLLKRNSRF